MLGVGKIATIKSVSYESKANIHNLNNSSAANLNFKISAENLQDSNEQRNATSKDNGERINNDKNQAEREVRENPVDRKIKRLLSEVQKVQDLSEENTDPNAPINGEKDPSRFDLINKQEANDPATAAARFGLYPPPAGKQEGFENLKNQMAGGNHSQVNSNSPNAGDSGTGSSNSGSSNTGSSSQQGWNGIAQGSGNINNGGAINNSGEQIGGGGGGSNQINTPTHSSEVLARAETYRGLTSARVSVSDNLASQIIERAERSGISAFNNGDGTLTFTGFNQSSKEQIANFKSDMKGLSQQGDIQFLNATGNEGAIQTLNNTINANQNLALASCDNGTCRLDRISTEEQREPQIQQEENRFEVNDTILA